MNNFDAVFTIIKENCSYGGASNDECYTRIEGRLKENKSYISITTYLEVLHDLGLIVFSKSTKSIELTEKGKQTESLFSLQH